MKLKIQNNQVKISEFILPLDTYILINNVLVLDLQFIHFTIFDNIPLISLVNFSSNRVICLKGANQISLLKYDRTILVAYPELIINRVMTSFIKLFLKRLKKLLYIVAFGAFTIMHFIGFRFRQRWFRRTNVLKLRLGYNKKVWIKCPMDFVAFIKKKDPRRTVHYFFAFNKPGLLNVIYTLRAARPATIYKGKGLSIREQPFMLKEGKKARW